MNNNSLAFTALCNEYCATLERAAQMDERELVGNMARLLPRIYICAADLKEPTLDEEGYIDGYLQEETYDQIRLSLESVLGEDDTYLEVFESDMKYSDTPIGASLAEGLADLFQVFYNFIETVRDAPDELAAAAINAVHDDFKLVWGQTLTNIMRHIHSIYYNIDE
ncbi:MAG: DUF5063 domain-containing protein [Muribaculaceae bacterium]